MMEKGQKYPRTGAAAFLQAHGLRTTAASLATMATRGGGPQFFKTGKHCYYWQLHLEMWVEQRTSGLMDSTSTTQGKQIDELFEQDRDLDDDLPCTGDPGFDEVTQLLAEQEALQSHINAAGAKYDQRFM
jgi:hypothetical protein